MLVELDVVDADLFRKFCGEHDIQIDSCVEEGPAGGNPSFKLTVDEKAKMLALVEYYFG